MVRTTRTCDCHKCNETAEHFCISSGVRRSDAAGQMEELTFDFDLCGRHQLILLKEYMKNDKCAALGTLFGMELNAT